MRLTFSLLLSLFSVSHYENNKNRKIKLWNNENNKRKRTKLWWQQFVSDFYKFIKFCSRQPDSNSIKVSTWKKIPFPDENSIYTKMT